MKILYISSFKIIESDGVSKKIISQMEGLKNNGNNIVDLLEVTNYKDEGIILLNKEKIYSSKILTRTNLLLLILKYKIKLKNYDCIYIRYAVNPLFYYFIKKNSSTRTIIEFPTYPYEGEILLQCKFPKLRIFIDRICLNKLKNYVKWVVTFSSDQYIHGIKCINISNGIDKIKEIESVPHKSINFICVAGMRPWHGVDRFLNSLENYYKNLGKESINFYIIGIGQETEKLKKIVKNSEFLEDRIFFKGLLYGKELDDVYNISDIAVGSLGIHRIEGLKEVQPLKNREYCAKGIPFILSFIDPDFINKKYVYNNINGDENTFDIESIIKWYKNLDNYKEEMIEYSKQFSWDIQMKKVIDNIGE